MVDRPGISPKKVLPFAPAKDTASDDGDPVERSGQAIVGLLREAATVAKETCERAMHTADQLSIKLRAAEDRVRELEADLQHYQVRATQAEKWLLRVHNEIEQSFFGPDVAPTRSTPASSRGNQ